MYHIVYTLLWLGLFAYADVWSSWEKWHSCTCPSAVYQQAVKKKNPSLNQFCGDACKENCRQQLLVSLGSKESIEGNAACCDVCTGGKVPSARLDVLVPPSLKRARKSKPVRDINKNMEQMLTERLLKENDKILEECPGLCFL